MPAGPGLDIAPDHPVTRPCPGDHERPLRRLARHLAALPQRPQTNQSADIPTPCDAPHQTTPGPPVIARTGPSLDGVEDGANGENGVERAAHAKRTPWIVGVSGASGTPYAAAVLRALLAAGEQVD